MREKIVLITPPKAMEKLALRLMISVGLFAMVFFLYSMLQTDIISYYPLYIMLMVTLFYYSLKYLHEWYHYFSIAANPKPVTQKIYSVDILTTYCAGEPFDMLEQTLTAIQNITYPHTTWCCDEADDPSVKALCHRLGVKHVTRIIKKNAKAGNINNALQYATGELCVVLDPDHIPIPEFLDRVVAYFDDPSIGFVQVVQAYYNQKESLVAKGAAQQTYQFYGPMMMTMHSYGTVQAIGANCTFRRSAIDSIGGHASGLSEDMHTAMQMHARGWRSIYVPEILTRGLVPATMSSYFKQQLKWSRGTWELLVTTYPKLFTKFSWRQKIHYATLPFHYLSGFIFLINFLIPVISLFSGKIPLKMDIVVFALAAFPLFAMGILIRYYVQKWVAEESERGFHLVGGILQIGTWWIHSIGFVYTLLRKKVPYIPTPKNDADPLPIILNLPNILVAVISLTAIVYGLWYDYTPYTIFMVVFASIQIFFMIFILSISGYSSDTGRLSNIAFKLREHTWLIKKSHGFLRKFSLSLSFLVVILFVMGYYNQKQLPTFLPKPLPGLNVFYRGAYLSKSDQNIDKFNKFFLSMISKKDIAIYSFEQPWRKEKANKLDADLLQKIYRQHAIPMVNWHFWSDNAVENKVAEGSRLQHIVNGHYDEEIISFARQAASLNKPIYLNISNEQIGNQVPLFKLKDSKSNDYVAAWQYVHKLFNATGANKVIWVWTAIDTASIINYFPGKQYVDWLNVNIKSNKSSTSKDKVVSFDSLYKPYHEHSLFNAAIPVMVTNLDVITNNNKWWEDVWGNIAAPFTEVKSLVVGVNVDSKPGSSQALKFLNTVFANAPSSTLPFHTIAVPKKVDNNVNGNQKLQIKLKSIVYDKGVYWFRNRHTMGLRAFEQDIVAIKVTGVNTIERTMPGFYDKILGKVLEKNHMNLIPRFWILGSPEEIADDEKLKVKKEEILAFVKGNLDKKYIIGWNLGDDVLFNLGNQLFKPDYFYYQQKYVTWLSDVCEQIRLLDNVRPIMIDLQWDEKGKVRFDYYKKNVPLINTYMLVAVEKYIPGLKMPLERGMAWGKVPIKLWALLPEVKESAIIPAWQDIENTDFITLNGLLDLEGRKKEEYSIVVNIWGSRRVKSSMMPAFKILKPAKLVYANSTLVYHMLYKKDSTLWGLFNDQVAGIQFEWYLVRTDQYGNTMFIKKAGEGSTLNLKIPNDPQYYKLYAEVIIGDKVKMLNTTLNTKLR